MPHCTRLNCPCSSDRALTYNRQARVPELDNPAAAMTDHEIRSMLMLLLTEWRLRMETQPGSVYDARH